MAFVALFAHLSSCVQHQQGSQEAKFFLQEDSIEVKYAEGFDIHYLNHEIQVISHSHHQNAPFADTLWIKTDDTKTIERNYFNTNLNAVVCQSSTHLAFVDALGELPKVRGVCGLNYVVGDLAAKLSQSMTEEICLNESVNIEKIQAISPDLFTIYPFESEGKEVYQNIGIPSFYIAEYLETTPLARLEWIKVFGLLFNKVKEANTFFDDVEQAYLKASNEAGDSMGTFILNLPFKDQWHMPSANSLIVQLIEDAGLRYFYESRQTTENDLHATEQVWNDAEITDYWIIMAGRPADFSLADLIAEEPAYAVFKPVKKQQVIFCNTSTSDYFTRGVVEPDVMLKDLLFATGQISNHVPRYFFLLK